jgi:hypothetical protein
MLLWFGGIRKRGNVDKNRPEQWPRWGSFRGKQLQYPFLSSILVLAAENGINEMENRLFEPIPK